MTGLVTVPSGVILLALRVLASKVWAFAALARARLLIADVVLIAVCPAATGPIPFSANLEHKVLTICFLQISDPYRQPIFNKVLVFRLTILLPSP